MNCSECGNKIEGSIKFCGKCGAKVTPILTGVENNPIKKDQTVSNIEKSNPFEYNLNETANNSLKTNNSTIIYWICGVASLILSFIFFALNKDNMAVKEKLKVASFDLSPDGFIVGIIAFILGAIVFVQDRRKKIENKFVGWIGCVGMLIVLSVLYMIWG